MKIDEFEEILKSDKAISEKFQALIEGKNVENDDQKYHVLSEAAKTLGYEVAPEEFAISERSVEELSLDELEGVNGGSGIYGKWCWGNYNCEKLYVRCVSTNECAWNHVCASKLDCRSNYHSFQDENCISNVWDCASDIQSL